MSSKILNIEAPVGIFLRDEKSICKEHLGFQHVSLGALLFLKESSIKSDSCSQTVNKVFAL